MVNCDPAALAASAAPFNTQTKHTLLAEQTYLLAKIAGGSTDPDVIAAQAEGFEPLNDHALEAIQASLLCQILNK